MARYIPKVQQVLAEQFDGSIESAQAIEALPGVKVRVANRNLFVFISRRWNHVNESAWVVRSKTEIQVMTNEDFQTLFELAP